MTVRWAGVTVRAAGQQKKPPFRKRGVGGILYLYFTLPQAKGRQQQTALALTVIPAQAGIHPPAYRWAGTNRGSGFRPSPE